MPRKLIHEHRYFIGVFAIYLLLGGFSFIIYVQGAEILFLNEHHTLWWNRFFVFFTSLAEPVVLTALALVLLFFRFKYFLVYIIDISLVGVIVTFMKLEVFDDRVRPFMFFKNLHQLHWIEGVPVLMDHSFPSGHTTVAFAVCFLLAIYLRRTWLSMILLIVAMLVGLSRIYLMEHFWIDVYFGSLIGILITLLTYIVLQKRLIHSDSRVMNWSLYERYFKRK